MDLAKRGCGVREIASGLGTTPARAARLLADGLATIPREPDTERATSALRIDAAARTFGALLDDPDAGVRLAAADGLVTAERLRTDLFGLATTAPSPED